VAVDPFLPSPDQLGFTSFASTRTPGHLGVDTTLWLDYALRMHVGGLRIDHRFDATAIAQLGLWSRGALALRLPVLLVQRGDGVSGAELASVGVGNPAVDGRVRLLGAKVRPDGSVPDGAALALRAVVHVPVGTSNALFADDRFRGELSAIGDIEMFGIGAGAALAYRYRADTSDDVVRAPDEHALRLSVGLRVPLPLLSRVYPGRVAETGLLEVDVQTAARDFFEKRTTPVEGRLGYRINVGDLFATVTFGAGFTNAIGAPDFRTVLALGYSPRQHDSDADGVPDGADQCEHLPEDRDNFQDEDGCADDDNDGDLIVDEDDRCPMEPAEMGRDDDEDGCTDT
jgi:OmpA-OmpF porin, OOP family